MVLNEGNQLANVLASSISFPDVVSPLFRDNGLGHNLVLSGHNGVSLELKFACNLVQQFLELVFVLHIPFSLHPKLNIHDILLIPEHIVLESEVSLVSLLLSQIPEVFGSLEVDLVKGLFEFSLNTLLHANIPDACMLQEIRADTLELLDTLFKAGFLVVKHHGESS